MQQGPNPRAAVSNSVTGSHGSTVQARNVYGGIHYRHRFRPKVLLLCAALVALLLVVLGYFLFLGPTSIRELSRVHGASVGRCVPVAVEGRAGFGRGLVVGVYARTKDVVYLSRVLDGSTTTIPLAVGTRDDRPGTAYDIVVLSAPTVILNELRQTAEPKAFTADELSERDIIRETKITVFRNGPGPDHC